MERLSLLFLASILAISHASPRGGLPLPIHHLRPNFGSGGHLKAGMSCDSWRLAIETHNIRDWNIPDECFDYVISYMLGEVYRADSEVVTLEAASYTQRLYLRKDVKDFDVWVFDIDETAVSSMQTDVSSMPSRKEKKNTREKRDNLKFEWGNSPALPGTLRLYQELVSMGIKIVFLTGRDESLRNVTEFNLKNVGYHTWEKVILRGPSQLEEKAIVYKSYERMKLEELGYQIIGNMGDQWSDILGTNVGRRTFKLPNPMYYVA